jgi:hypothetical protein
MQRKALVEAGAAREVVSGLEAIIRHLHRMPEHQILRMLGRAKGRSGQQEQERAIEAASRLSLDDVERKLADEEISRLELEALAIGRFHVPRGSMRSLRNISILREKLETLVQNERMHATIANVAGAAR